MTEVPSPTIPPEDPSVDTKLPPFDESQGRQNNRHTQHPTRHTLLLVAGAAIVGLGAVAGLGYAAWTGILPNPFMKRPSAENMLAKLQSITSAKTTVNMQLLLEPREQDVEPLDFSIFFKEEEIDDEVITAVMHMLPNDLALNLSIASAFAKNKNTINEEATITGTYTGNNISANIDLTTRTVDGIIYLKPDAIPLPIPLFDTSALESIWIKMNGKEETRDVFTINNAMFGAEEKEDEKQNKTSLEHLQKEVFTLLEQGVKQGAIVFSVPERGTYQEERAWTTTAVIDGEKLRETVIAIGDERETLFPETAEYAIFTNAFLEATTKERARDVYRELFSRLNLSATMKNDGTPLVLAFTTRLAPKIKGDPLKDRQITLKTNIHFDSINIPVEVNAPNDAISLEDAALLLLGTDQETAQQKKQFESIEDLQSALEFFSNQNGAYPKELKELIGLTVDIRKVTTIPNDIFTKQPYVYEKTETGYTLQYEVQQPTDDNVFSSNGVTVEGTNTATELFFSEEGAKETDEDEDGLSAYEEAVRYGTSDSSTDSDGDGFSDKAEVNAGYNPAGEGTLIQTVM